jgi:hypothetical protein
LAEYLILADFGGDFCRGEDRGDELVEGFDDDLG